jgi:hypothetical protein
VTNPSIRRTESQIRRGNRSPGELLWTLVKATESRRAELRDHGTIGAELQIFVNGEFVNGQWYETRALAMLQADRIRDALTATGFQPQ